MNTSDAATHRILYRNTSLEYRKVAPGEEENRRSAEKMDSCPLPSQGHAYAGMTREAAWVKAPPYKTLRVVVTTLPGAIKNP